MIAVQVQIRGLDALRRNFDRAPSLTLKYLADATKRSIHHIDAQVTEGGIMQFKTPRSKRTGHLVARFGSHKEFINGGLAGFTGPSVHYAPYVYHGTRGRRGNKYMDRIAKAAEPGINKIFNEAVAEIARVTARI